MDGWLTNLKGDVGSKIAMLASCWLQDGILLVSWNQDGDHDGKQNETKGRRARTKGENKNAAQLKKRKKCAPRGGFRCGTGLLR